MTERRSAAELIALLTDVGSFESWDEDVSYYDPLGFVGTVPYADRLAKAAAEAGTAEAVVTGRAKVRGYDVALVVGEFAFLAGTQGVGTAERVVRAYERALEFRLPVLALPISAGTRMQEGTVGFLQMVKTAVAVRRLREEGLFSFAYLRDPTVGGVLASWASLAQVTFAEPGALIALTGPRVVEALAGQALPALPTAARLLAHGYVDDVVAPGDLAERIATVLAVVIGFPQRPSFDGLPEVEVEVEVDPWEAVIRSREPGRPGLRDLLAHCGADLTLLRGDGQGDDDPGCVVALVRLCGFPVVLVGQDRPPGRRGASLGSCGYRKAHRAMELADELGLPLVTVIDTSGAAMTEDGVAAEIARCLATMTALRVPTVAVLLGEGSGAGAIALLPADRVVAVEGGWLSPIAPEGASEILYRTTGRAIELARAQAITSTALRRLGVVDTVIAETDDVSMLMGRVGAALALVLRDLVAQPPGDRRRARHARYRQIGL